METKEFYQEAEEMQPGWGKYLKKIDELSDRVDQNETITLKEACWIIYAESIATSNIYLKFEKDMGAANESKHEWPTWKQMFYNWERKQV